MRLFIGGLVPNVTEQDIKGRFSAMKNIAVTSVEIIMREDGVCKGFAYINTNCEDDEEISKLIKLYNGAKWKGKVLKVERAKPSYLDRIEEEKYRLAHPELVKQEEEEKAKEKAKEEEAEETEEKLPISGIPNTLMIRKTKRKFIVVSMNTVRRDKKGTILSVGDSTEFDSKHIENIPSTVDVVVKKKKTEGDDIIPVSTKKHRFVQPEVTVFNNMDVLDTNRNLWDPPATPKRNHIFAIPSESTFAKSSIQLNDDDKDDDFDINALLNQDGNDDGDEDISPIAQKEETFIDFMDEEEKEEKEEEEEVEEVEEKEEKEEKEEVEEEKEEEVEEEETKKEGEPQQVEDKHIHRDYNETMYISEESSVSPRPDTSSTLPDWLLHDDDDDDDDDMAKVTATVPCNTLTTDHVMTKTKREWADKKKEIENKRRRVEQEDQEAEAEAEAEAEGDDNDEDAEHADLTAENQHYSSILQSVLKKSDPAIITVDATAAPAAPVAPISSLFEESSVNAFSLFNFLPSAEGTQKEEKVEEKIEEDDEKEEKNVLDSLAPTAWFNDKKSNMKPKIINVPIYATEGQEKKKIPHKFDTFFYRTRSKEDIEAEWERLRPGLISDFERKKKDLKQSWKKKPRDKNYRRERQ